MEYERNKTFHCRKNKVSSPDKQTLRRDLSIISFWVNCLNLLKISLLFSRFSVNLIIVVMNIQMDYKKIDQKNFQSPASVKDTNKCHPQKKMLFFSPEISEI